MTNLLIFAPHAFSTADWFEAFILVCILAAVCYDIWLRYILYKFQHREQTSNERQAQALSTCMPSCRNISYPVLALCEEIAELLEKVLDIVTWNPLMDEEKKKFLLSWLRTFIQAGKQIGIFAKEGRHNNIQYFDIQQLPDTASVGECVAHNEKLHKARLELGDVKWEAVVADFYLVYRAGVTLDAQHPATSQETDGMNWRKLSQRKKDDTIDGKGDEVRTHI